MKTFRTLTLTAFAAAALAGSPAVAQVVGPGLSGFNRVTLLGNSDTFVSVPFARPEAAAGLVQTVSGNRITLKGVPGWQAGQFVFGGAVTDTFYALVTSGAAEGSTFVITNNDTNSIIVELDGGTIEGLTADDRISIIPFWTLGTLFAGGQGVHASPTPGEHRTEVLFPDLNATGINASASRVFYLYNGVWLEVGQGAAVKDHEIIPSDSYVIVRHNIAAATELVCGGGVVSGNLLVPLGVNTSGKRDNPLALQRPTVVTLAGSGLVASGAFSASPSPGVRTDELLVFDNAFVRQNKSAAATYYYWNNAWRKIGAGSANFDNAAVFTPGTGFIIRKNSSAIAPTWTNSPNY